MEERLPCPTCRTPAELEAELCLRCGAHLFVDVVVSSPPSDGRTRYQVARALAALPGAPPLASIQSGLSASPPVAARRVTRAFALGALPLLGEQGLRATIEKHVEEKAGGSLSPRTIAVGGAALAALGLAFAGWQVVVSRAQPPELRLSASDVPPQTATARRPAAPPADPRQAAQRALRAAASLRCRTSVGSGVFVAADLVLTNAHVLCPAGETIRVGSSDERSFDGEVVRRDDRLDLALVRATGANIAAMPVGDVGDVAVGDKVMIVGSPVGLDFTVQEGSISSLQRSANGVAYLQLDAKVSPGNSGGPVIDAQGRAVGIVSMKVMGEGVEGIGLALPINYAYDAAQAYVEAPSPAAAASPSFQKMLVRAQQSGSDSGPRDAPPQAQPPALPAIREPLLILARLDQYRNLVVRIARITEFEPGPEEITVKVASGLEEFCTLKGDIGSWKQGDALRAASELDPGAAAVLHRIAAGRPIYAGEATLHWDICDSTKMRPGIVLELQGGSSLANRIAIR